MSTNNETNPSTNTNSSLENLNAALFDQLKRLNAEDCDIEKEVQRSRAMSSITSNIIDSGKLQLEAERFVAERTPSNQAPKDPIDITPLLKKPSKGPHNINLGAPQTERKEN